MSYDFSILCAEQTDKLQKKLESINLSFIKEYHLAFNVINEPDANEQKLELFTDLENILNDQVAQCKGQYLKTFDRIQQVLARYLGTSK